MSPIRRDVLRRRTNRTRTGTAFAAAALAGVTLLSVTACSDNGGSSDARGGGATAQAIGGDLGGLPDGLPSELASALPSGLLDGLPNSLDELKNWTFDDWDKWAEDHVFNNPVIKGLWDPDKMKHAKPKDQDPPTDTPSGNPDDPSGDSGGSGSGGDDGGDGDGGDGDGDGSSDGMVRPLPTPIRATAVERPYTRNGAVGKIFFDEPDGTAVCSGTVVSDPAHPGKSNLVWTAGHCVHGGKGGDWYQHIIFVPGYNSSGTGSGGQQSLDKELAPLGQWWGDDVVTSPQWAAEGPPATHGPVDKSSQYDFAVVRVHNPDGDGRSLEETVGGAVPVWFNAPRENLAPVANWGYPAAQPFDGQELYRCRSTVPPSRLSYDGSRPPMLVIGCTMTGGSSGGGWFATMPDGRTGLVSNNSIGPIKDPTWEAGPYLGTVAEKMFDYFAKKTS
ncbi:trypsin-like serine peptidase [Streptomyces sp. NPDC092296]|uniref:trypsin-like serine peptidase n=1 Tax=Streptomyces sp. NPDC092296 TaxID=3366012 RepID=UPI0037F67EA1